MEIAQVADKLSKWILEETRKAGARGVVLGLSGGIDSAVVAGLAVRVFPDSTLGILMPCHSLPEDMEHAKMVAEVFGVEHKTVDLSQTFDNMVALYGEAPGPEGKLAAANIKPRLRMITLYYHAQARNALVLGTGNRSELTIGYFTKHGDGGVDLLPIGSLVKLQVRELAAYLGVPQVIIDKAPSAGLWSGQTDEDEMGITYEALDQYILTGKGSPATVEKVERMHGVSEHKRRIADIAPLD